MAQPKLGAKAQGKAVAVVAVAATKHTRKAPEADQVPPDRDFVLLLELSRSSALGASSAPGPSFLVWRTSRACYRLSKTKSDEHTLFESELNQT